MRTDVNGRSSTLIGLPRFDLWAKAEFPPDMGELLRVSLARVSHHASERRPPRLREEEPRRSLSVVKAHETPFNHAPGGWGQFRLTGPRPCFPGLELETLCNGRKGREEQVELTPNVGPFGRRELGASGGRGSCHAVWNSTSNRSRLDGAAPKVAQLKVHTSRIPRHLF